MRQASATKRQVSIAERLSLITTRRTRTDSHLTTKGSTWQVSNSRITTSKRNTSHIFSKTICRKEVCANSVRGQIVLDLELGHRIDPRDTMIKPGRTSHSSPVAQEPTCQSLVKCSQMPLRSKKWLFGSSRRMKVASVRVLSPARTPS